MPPYLIDGCKSMIITRSQLACHPNISLLSFCSSPSRMNTMLILRSSFPLPAVSPTTTKASPKPRGRPSKPPTPAHVTAFPAEPVTEPKVIHSLPVKEGPPRMRERVATARKEEPPNVRKASNAKTGAGVKKAKSTPMQKKKAGAAAATTTITTPIKRSAPKREKIPTASSQKAAVKKKE